MAAKDFSSGCAKKKEALLQYGKEHPTLMIMLHAAALLSETDLPIIEISGRVGYESQSRFAIAFRKEYGMTPLEYRKKNASAPGKIIAEAP